MRKYSLKFNYQIANVISQLKIGLLRKLRFIRLVKTKIAIRILSIFYQIGIIRTFLIKSDYLVVYFKFRLGQPVGKLSLVSRPGKRQY